MYPLQARYQLAKPNEYPFHALLALLPTFFVLGEFGPAIRVPKSLDMLLYYLLPHCRYEKSMRAWKVIKRLVSACEGAETPLYSYILYHSKCQMQTT